MICTGAVLPWEFSPPGRGDFWDIIMPAAVPPPFCRGFATVSSVLISGVETSHAQACGFARPPTPKGARAEAAGLVAEGLNAAPPPTTTHGQLAPSPSHNSGSPGESGLRNLPASRCRHRPEAGSSAHSLFLLCHIFFQRTWLYF